METSAETTTQRINLEFFHALKQNNQVIDWCMKTGLLASKMKCPFCSCAMRLVPRKESKDETEWQCRIRRLNRHSRTKSIRTGSWFSESKLYIVDILIFAYMWCYRLPSYFISQELGWTSQTVIDWKNICRSACLEVLCVENTKIGGEGKIVQINGSTYTNKNNRRRKFEGDYVYAGIERDSDNYFMCIVAYESKDILLTVIKKYVLPGTTIVSDYWQSYDCFDDEHFIKLSDIFSFVNLEDTLQDSWMAIKKKLTAKHGKDELDLHFAEYMWHRKYSNRMNDKFMKFLEAIKMVYTFDD